MKRLVVPVLVLVALVAALAAAAPFIVSTDLVKQRIADEIGGWTGRAVFFHGEPKVSLFPYLTVKLRDVEIGNPSGMGGEPLVKMDALVGKLKLLPLLLGRIEIAQFRLIEPHIALSVDAAGRPNWLMRHGLVAAGVTAAEASLPTPNARVPLSAPEITLGRFLVRDGTVSYDNALTGVRAEFGAVDMDLVWPTASEAASGSGSFAWGGETVAFNGSVVAPLALLAGGASPARFALASPSLKASFEGKALHLDSLQLDGETRIATPSLRRLLAQLGRPTAAGATFGAAAIAGKVNLALPTVSLDNAAIDLDGNHAEGALSASFDGGHPRIQGTIAFETLDLSPYVEAFTGQINSSGQLPDAPVALPLAELGDLDLRISTSSVVIGSVRIGDVAASASIKDGKLAIEVGEASFHEGQIQASLSAEMRGDALAASARAEIDGVPARAALVDLAGIDALAGTGSVSLDLSTTGRSWSELVHALAGTAKLSVAEGSFTGANLGALRRPPRQSAGHLDERRDRFPHAHRRADDRQWRRQHRRAPRAGRRLSARSFRQGVARRCLA